MKKVLIADDEQKICEMIKKMTDWESRGLTVAAMAENGLKLLELIQTEKPDIVITDIRMPGLDGLELVTKARELGSNAHFIIMSGYKSFEYAHTALNLGVHHYLLKPVSRKELEDTLDGILKEEEKDRVSRQQLQEMQESTEKSHSRMRQHFLNSILQDIQYNAGPSEQEKEADFAFNEACFLAFYLKLDGTADDGEISETLAVLSQMIGEILHEWKDQYITSSVGTGLITVMNYPLDSAAEVQACLERICLAAAEKTGNTGNIKVTLGIGSEKKNIKEVRKSIEEAVTAIKCRLKKGTGRIIYFSRLNYPCYQTEEVLTPQLFQKFRKEAETLDAESFQQDSGELLQQMKARVFCSPGLYFDMIQKIARAFEEIWKNGMAEEEQIRGFEEQTQLLMDRSVTEEELVNGFIALSSQFFQKLRNDRQTIGQLPIRLTRQYLSEHYSENITLEELAENAGLSPAYLSSQFKKENGIGISDYLSSVRMDEAKKLLKGDLPVNLIAEQVGFSDPKYFSRLFRKMIGIKPSEYRKLYR